MLFSLSFFLSSPVLLLFFLHTYTKLLFLPAAALLLSQSQSLSHRLGNAGRREDVDTLLDLSPDISLLLGLGHSHPVLEEPTLPLLSYFAHNLDGVQRAADKLSVVPDGSVSPLLKLEG